MITLELADQAATDAEVLDWAAKFWETPPLSTIEGLRMIYEAHAMPVRQRQVKESSEVAQLRAEIAMLQKQLGRLRSQVVDIVRRTGRNFDETRVFLFGSVDASGDDPSPLECMIDDALGHVRREIETRVDALEQRPTLRYRGIWAEDEQYGIGDMVSHQGSIWHCNRTAYGEKPNDGSGAFTLAVKSGRDGRPAKEPVVR